MIKLTSVDLTQDSPIVSVNDAIDLSTLRAGWSLHVTGADLPLEIQSGSNQQITLVAPYTGVSISGREAAIVQTSAPLNAAIDNVNELGQWAKSVFNKQNELYSTEQETVDITDSNGVTRTYSTAQRVKNLSDQAQSLIGSLGLPTKAEFEARHEGKYAGSGFVEWGKHYAGSAAGYDVVNQGLGIYTGTPNTIRLGR
ncbi:hypothetical protein, partial [Catenovulum sediminis]